VAEDEGFDDDGPEFLPPLAPEDRLWRHPAELASSGGPTTHGPAPRPTGASPVSMGRSPWMVGFVSVIGGVLLASSLMFGAGGLGDEPARIALQPIATLAPRADEGDRGSDPVALATVPPPAALVGIDVATEDDVRTGNGLVVSGDGLVVTTASLVAGAVEVRVTDDRGDVRPAAVAGVDALNDVALLRVEGLTRAPVQLDSDLEVVTGEAVRAFGASRGVAQPAWTAEIADDDARVSSGATDLHGAMQLDRALDPSATGAPVVRRDGEVIGIVTTLEPDGATHVIPTRTLVSVVPHLATAGHVKHGWLGVEGVTAPDGAGAQVRKVLDGSPAHVAGVAQNDIVVAVGDAPIETIGDLVVAVREHVPGTAVPLRVDRGGEMVDLVAPLGEAPAH
jgi:S1-C subfamily serine protease